MFAVNVPILIGFTVARYYNPEDPSGSTRPRLRLDRLHVVTGGDSSFSIELEDDNDRDWFRRQPRPLRRRS